MRLSIITINYNDKEGLRKTIDSVVNQTSHDFQYIVIDGGSTDGSADVLKEYEGKVDFAISEKDTGIYNAMNKGASHATGEYLMFLNSGDYLISNNIISELLAYDFDEDIVCGRCIDFDEKHQYLKIPPENVSLFTFMGGSLPHPASLIKRTLFESLNGYHEEYKIIGDWCFFIEALIIHNCTYKTLPIALVMFNCFGISSTSSVIEEQTCVDFLNKHFGRIASDYLPLRDEAISNVAYWVSQKKGISKKIWSLPFKIINRLIKGRNRLSRKIGIVKIDKQ